jgi:hypothetical protein
MIYRSIKPLLIDAIQVKEPADVATERGTLHVEPGEWLIRDQQGNITRCDDINFKCSYELFQERGSLDYLTEGKPCGA